MGMMQDWTVAIWSSSCSYKTKWRLQHVAEEPGTHEDRMNLFFYVTDSQNEEEKKLMFAKFRAKVQNQSNENKENFTTRTTPH